MNIKKGLLYYIEKYRINSIFFKTFMAALIVSLVLGGVLGFCMYTNTRRSIENEMYSINRESLMRIKNAMDGTIGTVSRISINLSIFADKFSICVRSLRIPYTIVPKLLLVNIHKYSFDIYVFYIFF